MFPTVAETLGEVCSCGRELCSRQLGLNPVSLIYFMYCGQSGHFLNKPRMYNTISINVIAYGLLIFSFSNIMFSAFRIQIKHTGRQTQTQFSVRKQ